MGYYEASIAPTGEFSLQLYQSAEDAVEAVVGVLKALRASALPEDADEINGVLDELEAAPGPKVTFFDYGNTEWTLCIMPLEIEEAEHE